MRDWRVERGALKFKLVIAKRRGRISDQIIVAHARKRGLGRRDALPLSEIRFFWHISVLLLTSSLAHAWRVREPRVVLVTTLRMRSFLNAFTTASTMPSMMRRLEHHRRSQVCARAGVFAEFKRKRCSHFPNRSAKQPQTVRVFRAAAMTT